MLSSEKVTFHHNWCKQAIIALKQLSHIVSSSVVQEVVANPMSLNWSILTYSSFYVYQVLYRAWWCNCVTTSPTGVAAFNINGMTLHSAFLLGSGKYTGFQPLNHDRLNTLRSKLSKLTLVIAEVSIVGSNMLLEIHEQLQQIKGVSDDVTFGGISILAVGQLPPVAQAPLFSTVGDRCAQLYRSGSLWVDEFQLIELDEIMRQRGEVIVLLLSCCVEWEQMIAHLRTLILSKEYDTERSVIIGILKKLVWPSELIFCVTNATI